MIHTSIMHSFIGKVAHSIVAVKVAETAAGELDEITSKSRAAPPLFEVFPTALAGMCKGSIYHSMYSMLHI